MTCSEAIALAPLALTGELEGEKLAAHSSHLRDCAACERYLSEQRSLDAGIRASVMAERIDTSALDRRVMQRIALEAKPRRWASLGFAMAGLAAVMVLVFVGYRAMNPAVISDVYASAAHDHQIEIVDGARRKWLSDPASVQELAARQGIATSAIGAIAPAGYRLEKGKLCRLHGQIFLHLVYAGGSGNYSVFLGPQDQEMRPGEPRGRIRDMAIYAADMGPEHVAGFDHGNLRAVVVTVQGGDSAVRLAHFLATNI